MRHGKWKMWPLQIREYPYAPEAEVKPMRQSKDLGFLYQQKIIKGRGMRRSPWIYLKKWSYKTQKLEPRTVHLGAKSMKAECVWDLEDGIRCPCVRRKQQRKVWKSMWRSRNRKEEQKVMTLCVWDQERLQPS